MNKNSLSKDDVVLADQINTRQSVRRYHASTVDVHVVERLLTAATRAPSAHNRQPWRFVVLNNTEGKHLLAEAMGRKLRQDRCADGDAIEAIEADISRSYQRMTQAPLVIVAFVDMSDMDRYPDKARSDAEYLMAVQSTAMAVQNILLAAHAEGLGASVMCAPLFCSDVVVEQLQLPRHWRAQMLLTIGASAAPGRDRPRLPLNDIVRWHTDK